MIITVIAFICVFGLLVFVHELGHFLAAKWMGVEVQVFAFGFPPTLWSRKVGETTYKINVIPLGGYVSMLGENEDEAEVNAKPNPRSLLSKEPWQIIFIMIAGVTMNVILAVILLWTCYIVGFQPVVGGMTDHPGIKNDLRLVVDSVEKDSPAERAALVAGDVIISVNGQAVTDSPTLVEKIAAADRTGLKEVSLRIQSGDLAADKKLIPAKSSVKLRSGKEQEVVRIGVALSTEGSLHGDIFSSFMAAISEAGRITALTLDSIIGLFRQLIFQFKISEEVSGPIGIVVMTNYFAQMGIVPLIQFAAILSLSLAIFNVLPIPALDGGQIVVTTLEMITRRKFSNRTKNIIQLVGFSFIIGLFLIITVKDFVNFGIIKFITGLFGK